MVLLKQYATLPDFDINTCKNNDGETAMTLAIKKRGYWRTVQCLLGTGAVIDPERSEALEQFAIRNQWVNTAKLIRDQRSMSTGVTMSMSAQ